MDASFLRGRGFHARNDQTPGFSASVSYFFNLPKLVPRNELGVSKYVAAHGPPRQPLGK